MPGLRPDLVICHHSHGDEVYVIIKDPLIPAYYKYSPEEWGVISGFDGTKLPEQIAEDYNRLHPSDPIDEETVEVYRQALKEMDLLALPAVEKSLQFVERMHEQRRNRAESGIFKNLLEIKFSAWNPDDLFNRIIPHIRFLWSKPFFILSLIAIFMMVGVNILKWEEFKQGMIRLYTFTDKSIWEIFVYVFLMTATGVFHEIGHGMTLKYFGGEVRQVGFLLFYLTPAFYCDISDSYILISRKQRLWVTFAGSYSELILCSIATFGWYFAVPGTLTYDLAFQVILFSGISSLLINMNPLIKLDGYYALMDWLEIPELREDAFLYLGQQIKKFFGLHVEEMEGLTKRRRKIFVIYGLLAILYTSTVYVVIVVWLRNIFLNSFHGVGYLLLLAAVYLLFRAEIRGALGFLRYLYLDKKEVLMKRKNLGLAAVSFGFILLFAFAFQTHTKISSRCIMQPAQIAEIRPEVDGFVREVRARLNDSVKAGQEVARLENPDLAGEDAKAESDLELLNRQLMILQSEGNVPEYQMQLRERNELKDKKNELDRKVSRLILKSPISGRVSTPYLEERQGEFLQRGAVYCKVEAVDRIKIEVPFREDYVEDVKPGQKVLLKLDAYPGETFEGEIQLISPAMRERVQALEGTYTRFVATAFIQNAEGRLIPGMQGDAKILGQKYSVTGRVFRELRRWIQSRIW